MKKLIVILFIIFGAFLTFSLYRTFAYDTSVVEEVPSTTDLEYTFKIGNSSIKQITVDSGETRYYDIVLGNPNNAKISYSVYYEMVSPSTKPDDYKIEYTSKSTGNSTGIVNNNGNITLNIVVNNTSSSTVTVKLGTVAGYVKGGELILNSGQIMIPQQTATSYVKSLNDESTGENGNGVYRVTHSAIPASSSATGEIIEETNDYRYYGHNPNNYICLDMEDQDTCPERNLYRIIGSIYEELEGENRLKVIKATPLEDKDNNGFSWGYTDKHRSNVWVTTTENGNLMGSIRELLNTGDYWNDTNDFEGYGLTEKIKKHISLSRYYLGGVGTSITDSLYNEERGTNNAYDDVPLYWDGMIGLMYPSDYGYAAGKNCATNISLSGYSGSCYVIDWLSNSCGWQWLMSPGVDSSSTPHINFLSKRGDFTEDYYINGLDPSSTTRKCAVNINRRARSLDDYGYVFPTFYLTYTTVIAGGIGSKDDPYVIK